MSPGADVDAYLTAVRDAATVTLGEYVVGAYTTGSLFGGGTMPVLLVRQARHGLALVCVDNGTVAGANQGDAGDDVQGLAQDVRMPISAGAGCESNVVEPGS